MHKNPDYIGRYNCFGRIPTIVDPNAEACSRAAFGLLALLSQRSIVVPLPAVPTGSPAAFALTVAPLLPCTGLCAVRVTGHYEVLRAEVLHAGHAGSALCHGACSHGAGPRFLPRFAVPARRSSVFILLHSSSAAARHRRQRIAPGIPSQPERLAPGKSLRSRSAFAPSPAALRAQLVSVELSYFSPNAIKIIGNIVSHAMGFGELDEAVIAAAFAVQDLPASIDMLERTLAGHAAAAVGPSSAVYLMGNTFTLACPTTPPVPALLGFPSSMSSLRTFSPCWPRILHFSTPQTLRNPEPPWLTGQLTTAAEPTLRRRRRTQADVVFVTWFHWYSVAFALHPELLSRMGGKYARFFDDSTNFPHLSAWWARTRARPAVRAVLAQSDAAFKVAVANKGITEASKKASHPKMVEYTAPK